MNTTPVKLSICIATRNREAYIGQTLDAILPQCGAEVEVVILDGASTDGTVEIVRGFQSRYANLRLLRAERNGGLDADFDRAVCAANGTYCWLFSDDDLIVPGGVARALEELAHEPTVLVVDSAVYCPKFERRYQRSRLAFSGRRTYRSEDSARFFDDTIRNLSFIGGLIVRRAFWESRAREPYYGSFFIHVGVLFQAPIPGTMIVLAEPLVQIRYGVSTWTARAFDIWMYKWPALIWSFDWVEESSKQRAIPEAPWKTLKRLVAMRAIGTYGRDDFVNTIRPRAERVRDLAVPYLAAAMPGRVAYAITRVGAYLRDPDDYTHFALDQSPHRWGPRW